MVAAASHSLILLSAARFSFFCFARQRAMRSWALALRRLMMIALASIVAAAGLSWVMDGVVMGLTTKSVTTFLDNKCSVCFY